MRDGASGDRPSDLVARCEAARIAGLAFPSVWTELLQFHPLVAGMPTHRIEGGHSVTEVALINGQRIVVDVDGYRLV